MNIKLVVIGKTDSDYLKIGFDIYERRLKHYINFELRILPDVKNAKNLTEAQQKQEEGKLILKEFQPGDFMVLLDEKGKAFTSVEFSRYIQKQMNNSIKNLLFVVGGPYGFSAEIYEKAHAKMSLSNMTFSHQMVRLFMVEQLYRAFTIIKGEPYHHE